MTDPHQQDDRDQLGEGGGSTETSKPLEFPGADTAPPGRPDGDEDPDDDGADGDS